MKLIVALAIGFLTLYPSSWLSSSLLHAESNSEQLQNFAQEIGLSPQKTKTFQKIMRDQQQQRQTLSKQGLFSHKTEQLLDQQTREKLGKVLSREQLQEFDAIRTARIVEKPAKQDSGKHHQRPSQRPQLQAPGRRIEQSNSDQRLSPRRQSSAPRAPEERDDDDE